MPLYLIASLIPLAFLLGWLARTWYERTLSGQLSFTPSEWEELLSGISSGEYKIRVERRQRKGE